MRTLSLALLSLAVAGCYSSKVAPDYAERANAQLAQAEKGAVPGPSEEVLSRLTQLFADRPDYVAIAHRRDEGVTAPRLRTSIPPKYPLGAYLSNAKATVTVAVILSETGAVEDARIYEASDARFSDAALEAVKAWTFYPGSKGGVPMKFLIVVPLEFAGREE
jgi:TonB family protein